VASLSRWSVRLVLSLARLALSLALLTTSALVLAATIEVDGSADPNSRLELRRYLLPDGTEAELYVLEGDPIVVVIDGVQRIEGRLIEFDPQARVVRIVGPGSFETEEQRIEGIDLEIALDEERLLGRDVLIVLSEIDVSGLEAVRHPGQIDVRGGLFSPCSRCDQETWDYGFRAHSLRVYPGDRLVAEGVTVLVRDVPVLWLPGLVLPLAEGDRQPVLRIDRATAAQRARVELRWPYVAGRESLGTFTVRYEADVDVADAGGISGRLLGGSVTTSYLGGSLDHRLYTDTGSGRLQVTFTPAFLSPTAPGGRTPARWSVIARFESDPALPPPAIAVRLERVDARIPGRWEYGLALEGEAEGVRGRFDSQGFIDGAAFHAAGVDPLVSPSYADRTTPRATFARVRLEPLRVGDLRVGPLQLDALAVDLGAFADVSNPANRAAAARAVSDGGRVLVRHAQTLAPLGLWSGATVDGRNDFEGRYYDTAERLVRWRSVVTFRQEFGGAGSLTLQADRDVNEGETPFRFDAIPLRNRSDATARLVLTPVRWLRAETRGGYTFGDTRRPEDVGWNDLDSSLRLFADRSWIDLELRNRYDLKTPDPGTLDSILTVQARSTTLDLRVRVTHVQDMLPEPGLPLVSDTRTDASWRTALDRTLAIELSTGYRYQPPLEADGDRRFWDPLDVRLSLGSMAEHDPRPGVRGQLLYDVHADRATRLQVDARAAIGSAEVDGFQRFELPDGGPSDSRLRLRWPGVLSAEARGLVLLRPTWLGLAEGAARARTVSVQVRDLPERGDARFQLTHRTTVDPNLAEGEGGRRNSSLELRVSLLQERLGPVSLSVDGSAEWALADDVLERTHLRRSSVTFGLDAFERVGVQGGLSYLGSYSAARGELSRSELVLDRVTLTVRATDELVVGARMTDVWDFTRSRADRSPWNFQPELFLLWDRCCWAFAASWNSATGAVRLVLTGPGAETGLEEILESPLTLPRRPLRDDEDGGPL
jgi:hypothetical protein